MPDPKPAKPPKRRDPTEEAFLESYDAGAFEHPSVTVDVVLLIAAKDALWTLLVERREHPCRGCWALPGGFVGLEESLDAAAARVLAAKAGLEGLFLEQLYTFGRPDRDPRTRVITVAYYALVAGERLVGKDREWQAAPEARQRNKGELARIVVPWQGETGGAAAVTDAGGEPLELAFDHAEILGTAVQRLRGKLDYSPIAFQLLPEAFTLRQLQAVHETILGRSLNKDSFRRRLLASGSLEATGEKERQVGYRPAALYRFTGTPAG